MKYFQENFFIVWTTEFVRVEIPIKRFVLPSENYSQNNFLETCWTWHIQNSTATEKFWLKQQSRCFPNETESFDSNADQ